MALKNITPEMAELSARRSMRTVILLFCLGFVCATVLAYVLGALQVRLYTEAAIVGMSMWIGFIMPATINRVVWDHVPLSLYGIETGQWLCALIIMSIVLVF